jgi:hypothetical protein
MKDAMETRRNKKKRIFARRTEFDLPAEDIVGMKYTRVHMVHPRSLPEAENLVCFDPETGIKRPSGKQLWEFADRAHIISKVFPDFWLRPL